MRVRYHSPASESEPPFTGVVRLVTDERFITFVHLLCVLLLRLSEAFLGMVRGERGDDLEHSVALGEGAVGRPHRPHQPVSRRKVATIRSTHGNGVLRPSLECTGFARKGVEWLLIIRASTIKTPVNSCLRPLLADPRSRTEGLTLTMPSIAIKIRYQTGAQMFLQRFVLRLKEREKERSR